jgi:hypothetical protein
MSVSVSTLNIRDWMALSVASRGLEKLRDDVPCGLVDNFAGQFELIGTIATTDCAIRKVPGDAKRVLAHALRLMTPLQLAALGDLLALGSAPLPEYVAMAQTLVDSVSGETICRPAIRGSILVERIS